MTSFKSCLLDPTWEHNEGVYCRWGFRYVHGRRVCNGALLCTPCVWAIALKCWSSFEKSPSFTLRLFCLLRWLWFQFKGCRVWKAFVRSVTSFWHSNWTSFFWIELISEFQIAHTESSVQMYRRIKSTVQICELAPLRCLFGELVMKIVDLESLNRTLELHVDQSIPKLKFLARLHSIQIHRIPGGHWGSWFARLTA